MQRRVPPPMMHRAVVHHWIVYGGGAVALDLPDDITGQTRQICASLDKLLAQAGSSKRHLLTAQVFMTDLAERDAMTAVWLNWIGKHDLPAHTTVAVSDLGPGVKVEVAVTAAVTGCDA